VISEKLDLDAREINDNLKPLKKHGLIKETGGEYSPASAIFTLEDPSVSKPIVKRLGLSAKEIISQRVKEVDNLIRDLDCTKRDLEFPDPRYIIVGAMTLDYNGLRVLKSEKLLSARRNMPRGGNYVCDSPFRFHC
jgi:DNA-binding Lrp family transcriptional regulator